MNQRIITAGLVIITLLSAGFLCSNTVSADTSVTKNAKIIVPPVCSIGATGMNTHTTTVEIGTYKTNIGTTTATVTCNDSEGFSIYASGFTGDKVGETNSNKLVGTSISSNATISTGTTSSGGTSSWSMKLAPDTSSNPQYPITILSTYSDYANVPSDYTKVATRTAATDIGTNAEGSTFTTTYAAYIANTQAADTYTGKVKYILVHPNNNTPPQAQTTPAGYIGYYPNASGVTGQMGRQEATRARDWSRCASIYHDPSGYDLCFDENGYTVDISTLPYLDYYEDTLYASNFKRQGYGFAGWNTKPDYSGTMYGPNETARISEDLSITGLSLYAVWVQSEGSMQHFTTSTCNKLVKAPTDGTAALDSVSALTDLRDGNTYAIAKLADDKCWMIENLRLDDGAELTAGNTNGPLLPLKNTDSATSNHLSPTSNPYSYLQGAWCTSNSSSCDDKSMLATNNVTLFIDNTASNYSISGTNGNVYSYGNHYNWYSATAGNGKYNSGSNVNVSGDICPSGWHLPTGGNASSEFGALDLALGGTGAYSDSYTIPTGETMSKIYRTYPNNFIYSGYVRGSNIYSRSTGALYWSSTANNNYAYTFDMNSTEVFPGSRNYEKYLGWMIRCLSGGS